MGIVIDPLRFLWCQLLVPIYKLRGQVKIICGDFFSQSIAETTVVTCYLLRDTNQRLEVKLRQELRRGTRIVSHTFTFPRLHKIRHNGEATLYLLSPE